MTGGRGGVEEKKKSVAHAVKGTKCLFTRISIEILSGASSKLAALITSSGGLEHRYGTMHHWRKVYV